MKTLHISVSDKIATYCQRDGDIVCGNSDYQIEFAFDSEWESYSNKTARFVVYRSGNNKRAYEDVDFTGTICPVPIFTNVQRVEVGVYAGELCTTTPAAIACKLSILCPDVKPTEAYDGRYASEAKAAAESAEAAAVRSEEAANRAENAVDSSLGMYDLVITSDEDFSKCLYALDGGSANTEFEHKNVLVKDVTFSIQRGSSDLDLHIFQPSIKYIKFENCRWETEWWVSGKEPTAIAADGQQYKRATGDFDLVIDGIEVSADNVQAAKDAGVYWYIGLRNIKALINSTVRYPEGYDISDGWNFKLTCQYFDYASNNHVPALWDGANVSDCYITEKLVRCSGCVNISSAPVLKDGIQNSVAVQTCTNLSNFSGEFSYSGCTSVNYDTCEGIENSSTQPKPYDYIVRSMTELSEVLTKNLTGRRILLRDFTISTADTLDFKWAGYVGFSNMLFGADINLANVWELNGAGLDASNNKWSVTVEGAGRSRVRNFGRLPGASTESKYTFKKCRTVSNCILGEASECSAIHGCYISKNADVVISGCTDICGLTVIPSGRTSTTTLSGCKNISHISNKGSGSIIYTNCTNVDYFTCDGFGDGKIPASKLDIPLGEESDTAFPGDRGLALEKKVAAFDGLTSLHIEASGTDTNAAPVLPADLEGKAFLIKGKAYFNARFASDNEYHAIAVDFCLPFLTSTIFEKCRVLGVTYATGIAPEPIVVFVEGTSSGLGISVGSTTNLYGYEHINRIDLDVLVLGLISE